MSGHVYDAKQGIKITPGAVGDKMGFPAGTGCLLAIGCQSEGVPRSIGGGNSVLASHELGGKEPPQ